MRCPTDNPGNCGCLGGRRISVGLLWLVCFLWLPVAQGQTIHHKTDYDRPLVTEAKPTPKSEQLAAELGVGRWIWTTNFADQQTCRLWHEFTISDKQGRPHKANLRITADDYYVCYLDGREIGRGGNWENLTDYDFTWLLAPGKHVLAVEAVNDIYEGGVLLGFRMQFAQGEPMLMVSDTSWRIVPNDAGKNWLTQTSPDKNWIAAKEIGVIGQSPWWEHPATVTAPTPLAPIQLRFWQTGWFIALMLSVLAVRSGRCRVERSLVAGASSTATSTNRTRSPGATSECGGVTGSNSVSAVRPRRCQPPGVDRG